MPGLAAQGRPNPITKIGVQQFKLKWNPQPGNRPEVTCIRPLPTSRARFASKGELNWLNLLKQVVGQIKKGLAHLHGAPGNGARRNVEQMAAGRKGQDAWMETNEDRSLPMQNTTLASAGFNRKIRGV